MPPEKQLEIHPAIGICRVGTSQEFFLGPESGTRPEKYRDAQGNLKRQACRFRVFSCTRDDKGKLLSFEEITPDKGSIEWSLHLVNRKAAAPRFIFRGDYNTNPEIRRNGAKGILAADKSLIIDPGLKTVRGLNQGPVKFDSGKFQDVSVPLGDIRTDSTGALIVAGGFGKSDSVPTQTAPGAPPIRDFADNDNWYDDVSDGPVRAMVTLKGARQAVAAAPARAVVAPPDYAPEITNLITLYDVALQIAIEKGWASLPEKPSFAHHVQPILARAVGYRWVNGFNRLGHGVGRPADFSADWASLADPNLFGPVPDMILSRLRDSTQTPIPPPAEKNPARWMPRLHDETNSEQVLALLPYQYEVLKRWAAGKFVSDLNSPAPKEQLPDMLDRVTLEACAGGAMFPGIEVGRIMRDPQAYVGPFRLDGRLEPGVVTQGNAVPWQADFYACTWDRHDFLGWWPAQRPDHVLPDGDYSPDPETQLAQLRQWDRNVSGWAGPLSLVNTWHQLGIVVRRGDDFVETERTLSEPMG